MKISLLLVAATLLLSLGGCVTPGSNPVCPRLSVSPIVHRSLQVSFRRGGSPRPIVLRLAWAAPGAPFYTPYGPLQSMVLTEGATTVVVPPASVGQLEDIWPEQITLRSARVGSYELFIPQGVPAPVPEVITIRAGRFVSLRTAASSYPPTSVQP